MDKYSPSSIFDGVWKTKLWVTQKTQENSRAQIKDG